MPKTIQLNIRVINTSGKIKIEDGHDQTTYLHIEFEGPPAEILTDGALKRIGTATAVALEHEMVAEGVWKRNE